MDELTYLRRRAAQEDLAAKMARSDESETIHRELSARYARKALALLLAEAEDDTPAPRNPARLMMTKKQSWRPPSRHPQQSHREEAQHARIGAAVHCATK
jgi:hypothetical protein